MRAGVRSEATVVRDMTAVGFPESVAAGVWAVVARLRGKAARAPTVAGGAHMPRLKVLRWRVDVVLGESGASEERLPRPVVLLDVALDSGRRRTVECSVAQLQALTFSTAAALEQMSELQESPVLSHIAEQV